MRQRILVRLFGPSNVGAVNCSIVYCLLLTLTIITAYTEKYVLACLLTVLTIFWMIVLTSRFSIIKITQDKFNLFGLSKLGAVACSIVYSLLLTLTIVSAYADKAFLACLMAVLTLFWMIVLMARFSHSKTTRDKIIAYVSLVTTIGGPFLCAVTYLVFDRIAQDRSIRVLETQMDKINTNKAVTTVPGTPSSKKVVPIYTQTSTLDVPLFRELPSSIRASSMDEVGVVAWISCNEREVGSYTGLNTHCQATVYEIGCYIRLTDHATGFSLGSEDFVAHTAPDSKTFCSDYHGRKEPVEAMQAFILGRLKSE